jgi:hypothetical protein
VRPPPPLPSATNPPTEKKQEKAKAEAEAPSPSNADSTSAGGLARQTTEDAGSGADQDHPAKDGAGKDPAKEAHPLSKKYRMTDEMKAVLWNLVTLSNECCRLENEKK